MKKNTFTKRGITFEVLTPEELRKEIAKRNKCKIAVDLCLDTLGKDFENCIKDLKLDDYSDDTVSDLVDLVINIDIHIDSIKYRTNNGFYPSDYYIQLIEECGSIKMDINKLNNILTLLNFE